MNNILDDPKINTIKSSYINYLPGIFRSSKENQANFIERYLKVFEKILTGIEDSSCMPETIRIKSLAEILNSIPVIFSPKEIPDEYKEFIDWLSSCVGLVLKEDWSIEKKRDIIASIIPIYRIRGTKKGLEEYIRIYMGESKDSQAVTIKEFTSPFQIGVNSTVGDNTVIGDGRPYYFEIYMTIPLPDRDLLEKKRKAIMEIIDKEKPIHTYYLLIINVPCMQVGVRSTVGYNTIAGGINDTTIGGTAP